MKNLKFGNNRKRSSSLANRSSNATSIISLSTRMNPVLKPKLEISLFIHNLFDDLLIELKEKHYVQAIEKSASKLFSSKCYLWLNDSVQLYSHTLRRIVPYNSSIVSDSFIHNEIIVEKSTK
jgi:hypothetical protein